MKIVVKAYGALQSVLGGERLEIETPVGASIQDILEKLAKQRSLSEAGVWDSQARKFCIPVIVMVSHADVQDFLMPLGDQQEIVLVAPMEGG